VTTTGNVKARGEAISVKSSLAGKRKRVAMRQDQPDASRSSIKAEAGQEPMFCRRNCRPDGLAPNKKRKAQNMSSPPGLMTVGMCGR
jgi:hypothetical protein